MAGALVFFAAFLAGALAFFAAFLAVPVDGAPEFDARLEPATDLTAGPVLSLASALAAPRFCAFLAALAGPELTTAAMALPGASRTASTASLTAVCARSWASCTTAAARARVSRAESAKFDTAAWVRAARCSRTSRAPSAMDLNSAPGRKAGTRDAGTFTVAPVAGLRAVRAARSRRSKTPKPVIATRSPREMAA